MLLDIKTQIDPKKVIVGDFNTPLSPIDRSHVIQAKSTKKPELNDIIYQMDLTYLYRIFHSATHYTHFSQKFMELSLK
jgi:hypothetical protein